MKILISGFGPFDGLKINPSEQLLTFLKNQLFKNELETILLPVSFQSAFPVLQKKIDDFKPELLLMTGLAQSRKEITFEKIAINFINARNPDNDGHQPMGEKILNDGPDGLFATLPFEQIISFSEQNKLPISMSYTAGTYVCNDLMYKTLYALRGKNIQAGFVHLPATEETLPEGPYMLKEKMFETMLKLLKYLDQ